MATCRTHLLADPECGACNAETAYRGSQRDAEDNHRRRIAHGKDPGPEPEPPSGGCAHVTYDPSRSCCVAKDLARRAYKEQLHRWKREAQLWEPPAETPEPPRPGGIGRRLSDLVGRLLGAVMFAGMVAVGLAAVLALFWFGHVLLSEDARRFWPWVVAMPVPFAGAAWWRGRIRDRARGTTHVAWVAAGAVVAVWAAVSLAGLP